MRSSLSYQQETQGDGSFFQDTSKIVEEKRSKERNLNEERWQPARSGWVRGKSLGSWEPWEWLVFEEVAQRLEAQWWLEPDQASKEAGEFWDKLQIVESFLAWKHHRPGEAPKSVGSPQRDNRIQEVARMLEKHRAVQGSSRLPAEDEEVGNFAGRFIEKLDACNLKPRISSPV